MTSPEARATVILVDNSPSSINGDFYPTRLEAQKLCITKIATSFFAENSESQIGVITMSKPEFGIRSSLTSVMSRVQSTIPLISRGKEPIDIEKAIKCALMVLKNCTLTYVGKRILLMFGSEHHLTKEKVKELQALIKSNGAKIDIVAYGTDVNNDNVLDEIGWSGCTKLEIIRSSIQLCDQVLASPICMSKIPSLILSPKLLKTDPELYEAIMTTSGQNDLPHFISSSLTNENKSIRQIKNKAQPAKIRNLVSSTKTIKSKKRKK